MTAEPVRADVSPEGDRQRSICTPPSRKRVTIADVAKAAQVSRSAVSRTFTAGASVAPATRERVERVAHELGYRPNALARNLSKPSRQLVAFVSGYIDNFYDAHYHDLILGALQQAGLRVLHVHLGNDQRVGPALLDALDFPVSVAVISGGSIDEAAVRECLRLNTPIVLCSGELAIDGVDCINSDNQGGMRLAVDHLMASGRRRIAFVGGTSGLFSARERQSGFRLAMQAHGASPIAECDGDFTFASGLAAVRNLFDTPGENPDALVCANDAMALGALMACNERGLAVPAEVAIVGFDDIPLAAWPGHLLTTIENPVRAKAAAICERVLRRAADPSCVRVDLRFPTRLILRRTA